MALSLLYSMMAVSFDVPQHAPLFEPPSTRTYCCSVPPQDTDTNITLDTKYFWIRFRKNERNRLCRLELFQGLLSTAREKVSKDLRYQHALTSKSIITSARKSKLGSLRRHTIRECIFCDLIYNNPLNCIGTLSCLPQQLCPATQQWLASPQPTPTDVAVQHQ